MLVTAASDLKKPSYTVQPKCDFLPKFSDLDSLLVLSKT